MIGGFMEEKIVPYQVDGKVLIYVMPKELDHHVAETLCKELDMLVDAHCTKELILDFAKTEFMDSSGIGVIIGRSKTMQFHEGTLYVSNMGKRIEGIFGAAGLYKIVKVKEI